MNNIAGTPTPEQFAEYLLRFFEHSQTAIDHAEWAFNHVVKAENKSFWKEVIEILKKQASQ
jgi:hypothetical protein